MARRPKPDKSLANAFWTFVEDNPQLAAAIAFQIGALAGQAVHGPTAARLRKQGGRTIRSLSKSVQDMPGDFAKALPEMPHLAQLTSLKFLAGPSPKLQPRKQNIARRPAKAPKKARVSG